MDYQETKQGPGVATPGAAGSTPRGAAGAVKEEVQRLAGDARQGASQVVDRAREAASSTADSKKEEAAERLGNIAASLRGAGGELDGDAALLGRYAGVAADELQKLSGWLRNRDMKELVRDTETFARRHPDLFIGASFVAGLAIARFLKSSSPEAESGLEPSPVTTSAPMMADEVRTFSPQPSGGLRTEPTGFGYAAPGASAYASRPLDTETAGFADRTGAAADLNVPDGPNARPRSIGDEGGFGPRGITTGYGPTGLGQSPAGPRSGEGGTTGSPDRTDEEGGL